MTERAELIQVPALCWVGVLSAAGENCECRQTWLLLPSSLSCEYWWEPNGHSNPWNIASVSHRAGGVQGIVCWLGREIVGRSLPWALRLPPEWWWEANEKDKQVHSCLSYVSFVQDWERQMQGVRADVRKALWVWFEWVQFSERRDLPT
jgi:hypothetical protein